MRINSILPGATETEGAASTGVTAGSEYEKMFIANTLLGRRGQPEDIAKAVVFIASDDAAWITGEQITVSGGMYLKSSFHIPVSPETGIFCYFKYMVSKGFLKLGRI